MSKGEKVTITLELDEELAKMIEMAAMRLRMSVEDYILNIIERELNESLSSESSRTC